MSRQSLASGLENDAKVQSMDLKMQAMLQGQNMCTNLHQITCIPVDVTKAHPKQTGVHSRQSECANEGVVVRTIQKGVRSCLEEEQGHLSLEPILQRRFNTSTSIEVQTDIEEAQTV